MQLIPKRPKNRKGGDTNTMNNLGKTLARIRKAHKLTQAQVTEQLAACGIDINPQTISRWELGLSYPRADQFLVFCELMKVDNIYAEFLGDSVPAGSLLSGLNEQGVKMVQDYITLLRESERYSNPPACTPESCVEHLAT